MIFADFEKIQFVLFGLDLLEPMAIITDSILGVLSVCLGLKLRKIPSNHPMFTYWRWFFYLFGIGAFFGGIGHTFFNYLGVAGKFPAWIAGPLAIYCLEQGMIALHPNEKKLDLFKLLSTLKLIVVLSIFIFICVSRDITTDINTPFLPIAINTIIGVTLTAGVLGLRYTKLISPEFKYFYLGVLMMIPSAFIFLMKINLHQWCDKNDLSHVLFALGIIYFYIGLKKTWKDIVAKSVM